MTRPWRRMILHLLQIFLTLGLTFTANFSSVGLHPALPLSPRRTGGVGGVPHVVLRATGKLAKASDQGDPPRKPYLYR
jgi:hypothetical protein